MVSAALSDVAKYLSEAATSIFKPTGDSNVPWDGSGAPFSGVCPAHASAQARWHTHACWVHPTLPANFLGLRGAAGRITHHDEVARLKRVYELVQEAKQQVSGEWPRRCMQDTNSGVLASSMLVALALALQSASLCIAWPP